MLYCAINGVETEQLLVTDRGLAYGDGLFTTAKIMAGKIEMLDAHLQRLTDGCQHLGFSTFQATELRHQLVNLAKSYSRAVLKVIITTGSGGRGYARPNTNNLTLSIIVMVHEFPQHYDALAQSGITLGVSEQKISINPMLAGIKHLNRLEQVLLRNELDMRSEDDLVVCNINNDVVEATSANLFWFKGEQLYTPLLNHSGVAGLMRAAILAACPNTVIKQTSLADLQQADAMFVCNSVMGIVPVKCYHQRLSLAEVSTEVSAAMSVELSLEQVKQLQKRFTHCANIN